MAHGPQLFGGAHSDEVVGAEQALLRVGGRHGEGVVSHARHGVWLQR